ncbi:MAG: ABC transporter permease [Candidatus Neomarinimicrobiota bacterium]
MLTFKLALKNLLGAGTRTWLNVIVTSLSFVYIVFAAGLFQGWLRYAERAVIETEIGGGAYWHPAYDPEDPFTIDDSHGPYPSEVRTQVEAGQGMPVLIIQGSIYTNGRMQPVRIKGIPPGQQAVILPTENLATSTDGAIPVLIGTGMSRSTGLQKGNPLTIRWRDSHGTYDADEGVVVSIFSAENFKIDLGQIWIPLDRLQKMAVMPGEATYVAVAPGATLLTDPGGWRTRTADYLLADVKAIVNAKMPSIGIFLTLFIALACLGIFNSQVLSIFRRRKEIGTLMALGMARSRVVGLFTTEGGLHSLLAVFLAAVWGGPLMLLSHYKGIPMPYDVSDFELIIAQRIFPVYSVGFFIGSIIVVATIVTIVSYLPTRRIAKMEPTEALHGRVNP